MPPRARRATLFDAGNTLLWIDHARIAAILCDAGVAATTDAVRRAEMGLRPKLDAMLAAQPRREGADTVRKSVAGLLAALGASPSPEQERRAHDALLAAWPRLWIVPPPDAAETLDRLAARGDVLACVSNSNGRVAALLEETGLARRLAVIVDSGIEGIEKPDPRIFAAAAERIGVAPGDCTYVGDLLRVDVLGARAAGMRGVLYDPGDVWGPSLASGAFDPPVARVRTLAELVAS